MGGPLQEVYSNLVGQYAKTFRTPYGRVFPEEAHFLSVLYSNLVLLDLPSMPRLSAQFMGGFF